MSTSSRRIRHPDSLAASVAELLEDYGFPLPTYAVRVILVDRGRSVTAEHLGRLAAYERTDFLRTGLPPRLCSAIDTNGYSVVPRWWVRADWRLQRRILAHDVRQKWLASLAGRLCAELAGRQEPPGSEIATLALWAIARLDLGRYFDVPCSAEDWMQLRGLVVSAYPVHSLDGATDTQRDAEQRFIAGGLSTVELYFGRP
jgi:hypothetical protein